MEWKVESGFMPCLHRLEIESCNLVEVPDGLQDVSTLKELTINEMRRRFCGRLGEGGEDFYKIKYVPSLIITNTKEDEEPKMGEAAGAAQIVSDQASDSHQESTVDTLPSETEEIQASSSPNLPC